MTGQDPGVHVWWLASRAAGITALVLVTVSVTIGLALAGGWEMTRPGRTRALMAIHEHAAVAGLIAIAVHAITLLGDPFLHPGIADIAIPFRLDHAPVFTGLGVIAMWLAVLLGLSFYARRRIGTRRWRRAHRAVIAVYLLAVAHTLGSGTDAGSPILLAVICLPAGAVAVLAARRRRVAAP